MKELGDKAKEKELHDQLTKLEKKYSLKEKAYNATYTELKELKVEHQKLKEHEKELLDEV